LVLFPLAVNLDREGDYMNRRTILAAIIPAILAMFFGVRRSWGKASPKAAALAHNGIISLGRTPHLLGCKVYVNGKRIKHAISVNTTKGYVLAYGDDKSDSVKYLTKQRVYGYIEVDASDCMKGGCVSMQDSIHGVNPNTFKYDDSVYRDIPYKSEVQA
jgi:hypothetical protein